MISSTVKKAQQLTVKKKGNSICFYLKCLKLFFSKINGLLLSKMILLIRNPGLSACFSPDWYSSGAYLWKFFNNLWCIFSSIYKDNNIYFKEQLLDIIHSWLKVYVSYLKRRWSKNENEYFMISCFAWLLIQTLSKRDFCILFLTEPCYFCRLHNKINTNY